MVTELLIGLTATRRDDGMMFVVSHTHPYICAVVEDEDWDAVKKAVKEFLEVNFGHVKILSFVEDGDPLPPTEIDHVPPAHVIAAEVTLERVGIN